jgi:hypothetical protein
MPIPQWEFGFTADTFNLVSETAIDVSGQSNPASRGHFKIGQFERHEYVGQGELTDVSTQIELTTGHYYVAEERLVPPGDCPRTGD